MHRLAIAAPAAAISVLLLAGCGSSGSPSSGLTAAGKRSDAIAFAACMRRSGVPNFPDPGSNGHGGLMIQARQRAGSGPQLSVNGTTISAPAFQAANLKCSKYLPNGGKPTAAETAQARAQALAMSRCMRSHGVPNFPDPTFGTGPGGGTVVRIGGPGIDPSSPAFQHAQNACGSLLGGPKGGGGFRVDAPAP